MDATDSIEFAGRAYQLLIVIWVLTGAGTLLLLMWAYARFAIKPSGGWALFWASLYWVKFFLPFSPTSEPEPRGDSLLLTLV